MFGEEQRFGLRMERWVLTQLHERGYADARLVSGFFDEVDIMLGPLPVEVKAARPRWHRAYGNCWRQRWQFNLASLLKHVDSVVILVAVDDQARRWPYICPSWLFFGRRTTQITSHPEKYRGRLKPCLNQWANIDLVLARRKQQVGQLPLFFHADISQEISQ